MSQRSGDRQRTSAAEEAPRGAMAQLSRVVPILSWLPAYKPSWLTRDLVAGVTVWGLLVPEMIAYASLAGLPPQAGLYTLLASLALYAIFGTSRQLVVAGTSASAVLLYSTVSALQPKDAAEYAQLAAGLVILTGLLFLVAGVLRLGFITQFLSRPVMEGFVFGLAIFVTVGQVPKLLGLSKGEGNTIRQVAHLLANLGEVNLPTVTVGLVALALLFVLARWPRVPGGLIVLVAGIVVSSLLHLDQHGVATVGKVAAGLPGIGLPHLAAGDLWVLLPSAVGLLLVIFSEALGAAQTFADRHGYRLNPSQDMMAFGLANVGSGLVGGLAAGGSLSQTAVNDAAGARSQLSTLAAAALGLVTVVALTPLFTNLPEAVLAAMIIHAVSHLMKVGEMRRFYRLAPLEFWLGMLTLLGVITLDVLPGLVIGVVTSIVLLVYHASRPRLSIMGADPAVPGAYEDIERHPDATSIPGVLTVRPDGPLFYANAQTLRDSLTDLVRSSEPPVHTLVLDLDANDALDITTAETLAKLVDDLHKQQIRLGLAHAHSPVVAMLERSGVTAAMGDHRIFPNLASALAWAEARPNG